MPVLMNPQGLAENIAPEQVPHALSQGYGMPVNNAQGEPEIAPDLDTYNAQVAAGTHTPPSGAQLKALLLHAEMQSPLEGAKAFAEGAAQAPSFGTSTGAEIASGISTPQRILARREEHPILHALGQGAGMGLATAVGQPEAAATATVGDAALKSATEMLLLQSGDEVSKMFAHDPEQTMQTAAADMGIAGVLGLVGGAGMKAGGQGLTKLFEKSGNGELGQLLGAVREKVSVPAYGPEQAADPMLRAALEGDPNATETLRGLLVSSSPSGDLARDTVAAHRNEVVEDLVKGLGFTKEQAESLPAHLSENAIGRDVQSTLAKEMREQTEPIVDQLNAAKARVAGSEVPEARLSAIEDDLKRLQGADEYASSPGGPAFKHIQRQIEELPNLTTVGRLSAKSGQIYKELSDPSLWHLSGQLRGIFDAHSEDSIVEALQAAGHSPQKLLELTEAKAGYRELKTTIEDLNHELHAGRFAGPESFAKAVSENLTPEDLLRRLGAKDNADFSSTLTQKFPQTAAKLRDYQMKELVGKAVEKARAGEWLNHKYLLDQVEKWSPEFRAETLDPAQSYAVQAAGQRLAALPTPFKAPIGSTLERVIKTIPKGVSSLFGLVSGHPTMGMLAEALNEYGIKRAPDQLRVAMLRFLGQGPSEIQPTAFRALSRLVEATSKAQSAVTRAADAVVSGSKIPSLRPLLSTAELKAVEDSINQFRQVGQQDDGTQPFHYANGEGQEAGALTARIADVLSAAKPSTLPSGPFADPRKPSKAAQTAYERTANLANQPTLLFQHLKDGSLTISDVHTVATIYPKLYQNMVSKLSNSMIEAKAKDGVVSYRLRLGASRFMGHPLDATLQSQAIQAAQSVFAIQPAAAPAPKPNKTGMGKIKASEQEMLPTSAAAYRRQSARR